MKIIELKNETQGQAETSLLGLEETGHNGTEELVIANADHYTWNAQSFIKFSQKRT